MERSHPQCALTPPHLTTHTTHSYHSGPPLYIPPSHPFLLSHPSPFSIFLALSISVPLSHTPFSLSLPLFSPSLFYLSLPSLSLPLSISLPCLSPSLVYLPPFFISLPSLSPSLLYLPPFSLLVFLITLSQSLSLSISLVVFFTLSLSHTRTLSLSLFFFIIYRDI